MQVSRWGDSLAVRLPKAPVEVLALKAGDDMALLPADAKTMVVAAARRVTKRGPGRAHANRRRRRITDLTARRPTRGDAVSRHQYSGLRATA